MAQSAQSWEQILVAAKKEGMVSVIGPQGSETRDALTMVFQKKYPDIRVDLQSMAGNQIGPKLFNELAAGRNTTDLLITGTTTALETLSAGESAGRDQTMAIRPEHPGSKQMARRQADFFR